MAKQKKKRNKVYTGADATITRPTVTRISAVNRSKFGQWWFDHRQFRRPVGIIAVVIVVVIVLVVGIISLVHN